MKATAQGPSNTCISSETRLTGKRAAYLSYLTQTWNRGVNPATWAQVASSGKQTQNTLLQKKQLSPVLYSLLRYTLWNKVSPEQLPAGLGSTTQKEFYTGGLKGWNYGVQKKKSTQNLKINLKSASTQPASHTICALCINNQETSQVKVPAIYTSQHREGTAAIHRSQQYSAHTFLPCTVEICSRTPKELVLRHLAPSALPPKP